MAVSAVAQEDKKTDDDKPADPDTGQSTIEETTMGLLPKPLTSYGIKFAATYIGEALGNPTGGAVYEGRLNLVVDADLEKLTGGGQALLPCQPVSASWGRTLPQLFAEFHGGQRH
jgi:porin